MPSPQRRIPVITDLKRLMRDTAALRALRHREYLEGLLARDRYRDPLRLCAHEAQVFSQGGEDGVIAEILRRIGAGARTFLEIGVGDGLENNTTFLLWQGWNGWWVEGNPGSVEAIRRTFAEPLGAGRLRVQQAFVTAESVADLVGRLGVPAEVDLVSLDIDRNTYWIWKALPELRPRVLVVEYNASIPAGVSWVVDYDAARTWDGTLYFGASLKALEELGRERGYALVGCSLTGGNAFFVREDLCGDRFLSPFTAENHYEPPRYFLNLHEGHPPGFSDG